MDFVQLKKNCKKDASAFPGYRLALLGDCATQHLAMALKGAAYEEGIALSVFDADYNQLDAQTLDPSSELYEGKPQGVVLCLCTEKLYEAFTLSSDRAGFADATFRKIKGYWDRINAHLSVSILQFTFVERDDRVFGNYALKEETSFYYQVKKLNLLIAEGTRLVKNVYPVDVDSLERRLGRDKFSDPKLYAIAKMPFSLEALPLVAFETVGIVKALMGRFKKCVVLDLDNTLWGGVIGDDGMEGIQIGELGTGHAFTELQRWLKELKNRGIILCVCSKNNENTAKEPFEKHPEMILRLDDISLFVANWHDKASNIRYIQKTINIGMDSIVFLDDNPFERNLVKQTVEGITVPDLPEDPADYLPYLQSLNLFETTSYSENDRDRTKQYQAEIGRILLEQSFESFDDYLKGLDMVAEAKSFDPFHYPRIAQLTQRSNQFNLRTVRYTEAEIEKIAGDERYLTLYFTLKDKFGDHGLISVVILEKRERELFVHEWLMSCRVLKRGMEEFIVNKMIETAKEYGYASVVGEYIKTPKNAMVETIYAKLGFTDRGDHTFVADCATFQPNKTFIKE
ncbi:MAG: HAD family hydrolase [Clostridia bacterium]|nr:HAD family hydrolase [Clostridia bacterium]